MINLFSLNIPLKIITKSKFIKHLEDIFFKKFIFHKILLLVKHTPKIELKYLGIDLKLM